MNPALVLTDTDFFLLGNLWFHPGETAGHA